MKGLKTNAERTIWKVVDGGRNIVEVELTRFQLDIARQIASQRHNDYVRDNPQGIGADPVRGWEINFTGSVTEMATAVWKNVFWDGGLGLYDQPDVGPYQVRGNSEPWGDLILKKKDELRKLHRHKFILALAYKKPVIVIFGWMFGAEVFELAPFEKRGDSEAWWMAQKGLRDLKTLETFHYEQCLQALAERRAEKARSGFEPHRVIEGPRDPIGPDEVELPEVYKPRF